MTYSKALVLKPFVLQIFWCDFGEWFRSIPQKSHLYLLASLRPPGLLFQPLQQKHAKLVLSHMQNTKIRRHAFAKCNIIETLCILGIDLWYTLLYAGILLQLSNLYFVISHVGLIICLANNTHHENKLIHSLPFIYWQFPDIPVRQICGSVSYLVTVFSLL